MLRPCHEPRSSTETLVLASSSSSVPSLTPTSPSLGWFVAPTETPTSARSIGCVPSRTSESQPTRSIVRAIIGLGRSFNMPIVAEGVETEAQRQMLLDEGCPQAQGFYFGRPEANPFAGALTDKTRSEG